MKNFDEHDNMFSRVNLTDLSLTPVLIISVQASYPFGRSPLSL